MSTGLYSHTTRATGTVLTATIYNGDHQNHITNQNPSMTGAYSDTVPQMQSAVSPGTVGAESLASSLAGELERLRYVIKKMNGAPQWYPGLLNTQGSNIASAATVNLDNATGDYVHITGTTGISAITLAQGVHKMVVFDGALTLTNGASLILPAAANISTVAGDIAMFVGEAAGVVRCVNYMPASYSVVPAVVSHAMELRLTLATGTPVTTADQTAKTTIFLTPYKGGKIDLFDGTSTWNRLDTAEVSVAVPATTVKPFDIWARNVGGVVTLDTTDWTNDTTRATALVYQNGVLVKSGDTTRRYLGTGRTTGVSGQCEDSASNRFLWNYYNRVERNMLGTFGTNRTKSGAYGEFNTEVRCNFVLGVSEDAVHGAITGTHTNDTGTDTVLTALAFDSTTVPTPGFESGSVFPTAGYSSAIGIAGKKLGLAVGFHFATVLGATNAGNSTMVAASAVANGYAKPYLHLGVYG